MDSGRKHEYISVNIMYKNPFSKTEICMLTTWGYRYGLIYTRPLLVVLVWVFPDTHRKCMVRLMELSS
jgi:hypothetical protein